MSVSKHTHFTFMKSLDSPASLPLKTSWRFWNVWTVVLSWEYLSKTTLGIVYVCVQKAVLNAYGGSESSPCSEMRLEWFHENGLQRKHTLHSCVAGQLFSKPKKRFAMSVSEFELD
jgi:hypothetical protein